ncbi:MAG: hypothetical protein IPK76_15520 [Lewinellaceae bacterium]|nr:hypothetical protein [Lewinellaceae bacterium]
MKYLCILLLINVSFFASAQINVHEATIYIDANNASSGFPTAAMVSNIQEHLNRLLTDKGEKVNVLILSQECPRLEYVIIDGQGYWKGPEFNGSDIWCKVNDPHSKVIQILPGDALSYNTSGYTANSSGNSSNGIWQGLQFQDPWQPHNVKYYCLIHQVLNRIYGGGDPVQSLEDCQENMVADLDDQIAMPNLYLGGQSLDMQEIQGALRQAKSTFCTNLLFYAQYLHTRDLDAESLKDQVISTIGNDYILIIAQPKEKSGGGNLYSQVLVDFGAGTTPSPDNCFPTSRTLSADDEDLLVNRLLAGGIETSLNNVKTGIGYLMDYVLTADQEPVPGAVSGCDYGQSSGGNGNNYLRVNFPEYEFYGPELPIPGNNGHVTWYNNFENADNDVINACTEAALSAASHGLDMQFILASGCGTNNDQFSDSRSDYELTEPIGAGAAVWMYYDQCSDRLFYDVKLSDDVMSQLNPGYGITNPDSIAAIKTAMEDILKRTLEEVSKLKAYENATLDESEYPPNQNLIPGGFGSTCGDEDPWRIGLRNPAEFDLSLIPQILEECFMVLCEMVAKQEFPKRAWHPQPTDPCLFDMPGAAVGVIDGCLDRVNGLTWTLIGLLNIATEFIPADGNTKKAMLKGLVNPLNLIIGQYTQTVDCIQSAECQEEKIHCFVRLLTNAFFDIFSGQGLLNASGNLANVGATVKNKMKMFNDDFGDAYNTWKRTIGEGKHREHDVFLGTLPDHAQAKMTNWVSVSRIWHAIADGQVPGVSMQQFEVFVKRMPAYTCEAFYEAFEEVFAPQGIITDPAKVKAFIEDANSQPPNNFINEFADGKKYMKAWDEAFKGNLVHLRINFGFLQTIDDFLKDVNPTPLAFSGYGCSLVEHALIRFYTTDYYSNLNLALEGVEGFILTSEFIEFKSGLNVALSKLPDYYGCGLSWAW